MGMFGSKKRQAKPLQAAMFGAVPMLAAADVGAAMAPMSSNFGPVEELGAADVGVSLPSTRSISEVPRMTYRGPDLNKWSVIGATLQQMANGGNQINQLIDAEDRRQRPQFDAVMDQFDALKQREPLDRLTAGMDPETRDLFQIAPEFALKRMYPEQQKIDPIALARLGLDREKFEFERGNQGQMTPYQRALLGIEYAKLNQGNEQRAAELKTKQDKVRRSLEAQYTRQGTVLDTIGRAKTLTDPSTTGFLGNVLKNVGGTQAADLSALVDTIGANIGFKELQEMRDNSPTGGALGQVTERELALLQAVVGSLKQSQSTVQFRRNLSDLEMQYQRSMANIAKAYEMDFGAPMPGAERPAAQPGLPPGVVVRRKQ